MVGNTRGIAAISLGTVNRCHYETKNIRGFNCNTGWGWWGGGCLTCLCIKWKTRGEERYLWGCYTACAGACNHFDVSLSETKWIQIPGCWGECAYCKRARSWANERIHTSKSRPVNSRVGIYVCSEPWKPQGHNIYMKSVVCVCVVCVCKHAFLPVCLC